MTGSAGITHFLRVAALAHEIQDFSSPVGLEVDQTIEDGGIVLGDEPGLGIRVDESRIAATQVADPVTATDGPHVRPGRAGLRLLPESYPDGRSAVQRIAPWARAGTSVVCRMTSRVCGRPLVSSRRRPRQPEER